MPESWDNIIRNRLRGHRTAFNPQHWDALEARLDAQAGTAGTRRRAWWYRYGAAALLLLLLGGGGYLLYPEGSPFGADPGRTYTGETTSRPSSSKDERGTAPARKDETASGEAGSPAKQEQASSKGHANQAADATPGRARSSRQASGNFQPDRSSTDRTQANTAQGPASRGSSAAPGASSRSGSLSSRSEMDRPDGPDGTVTLSGASRAAASAAPSARQDEADVLPRYAIRPLQDLAPGIHPQPAAAVSHSPDAFSDERTPTTGVWSLGADLGREHPVQRQALQDAQVGTTAQLKLYRALHPRWAVSVGLGFASRRSMADFAGDTLTEKSFPRISDLPPEYIQYETYQVQLGLEHVLWQHGSRAALHVGGQYVVGRTQATYRYPLWQGRARTDDIPTLTAASQDIILNPHSSGLLEPLRRAEDKNNGLSHHLMVHLSEHIQLSPQWRISLGGYYQRPVSGTDVLGGLEASGGLQAGLRYQFH